jgi:aminoglycoside/choline kinase family phosphotransferase
VDENEVRSFETGPLEHARRLAFTGIHVLDRRVLDFIPPKGFAGIIDAYRHLLAAGHRIRAYVARNHYWRDIGTPESYQDAVFEAMAAPAFAKAFGRHSTLPVERRVLHGDGSDRRWYRLVQGEDHLILADHHIRSGLARQEVDAYVDIGRHLHARDVPVPRIYAHDNFSGLVFVEDLGDTHFQSLVADQSAAVQRGLYRRVIDLWIEMGIEGAKGFDTAWTYQTTHYDRRLILDREARYFTDAFLRNYLQRTERYEEFADEFERLADAVFDHAVMGFMHRDMQSRNIMARGDAIFFLDFQAGRIGPVQYDLAALLIDPYVGLSYDLQEELHDYAAQTLSQRHGIDPDRFKKGYSLCRITRNLQILGAFAFLSRVKGKTAFETYIPAALKNLRYFVHQASSVALPKLAALVDALLAERGR